MKKILALLVTGLLASPLLGACAASPDDSEDQSGDQEMDDSDAIATGNDALGSCYCAQPYTCGHSTSPTFVYPAAETAFEAIGIPHSEYLQTFGDAKASVGTHCPEPGTHYSAATDLTTSSHPCERVHALRMHGFAAWYRFPPSFSPHIHAVYAGTPVLKSSLKNQIQSFLEGRNGLVSNAIDTACPITQAEKNAVAAVHNGGGTKCVAGGYYCGGDKVTGSSSSLYRCDAGGASATLVKHCANGCRVNPGTDDACK